MFKGQSHSLQELGLPGKYVRIWLWSVLTLLKHCGVMYRTGLPGTGLPGTGLPGTGLPGAGLPGTGLPGTGLPGTGLPGTGLLGTGLPGRKGTGPMLDERCPVLQQHTPSHSHLPGARACINLQG
jgi:hypothetical protein